MSATVTSFYVTGGNLPLNAPSYVERQADRDLYDGLMRGEYCYVLHARQMGKSSLMVHTTARLRQEGIAVAAFELTALGQNLTVEQWYDGLLSRIGRELGLEEEVEEYWLAHERQSPLQRWLGALEHVVLAKVPGRIVLFLDEIDAVRSLSFSTDEFFAAIRECYNRRTQDLQFARLAFCLLGVATPSDLIQDTRTTPFNIGRRIELTDFTPAEAAPLVRGLMRETNPSPAPGAPALPSSAARCPLARRGETEVEAGSEAQGVLAGPGAAEQASRFPGPLPASGPPLRVGEGFGPALALLERVLYWTGGHPYLTQRLCAAVAQDESVTRPSGVDRLCEALFLSKSAQEKDDNLLFVRERLLRGEGDRANLLDMYAQVRGGKRLLPDDTNELVSILRLSGITRVAEGSLRVRNRIYEQVFDRAWVVAHMPDAELRRQRAAYRQGLLRATALAVVVLAVMSTLAFTAVVNARLARRQQQRAEAGELKARQEGYLAQMNLAQQAWDAGNAGLAMALLEAQRPKPGQADLRGFEWRYLWRLCYQGGARSTLAGDPAWVGGVALSPDGQTLASQGADGTVKLWDLSTARNVAILKGHTDPVQQVVFSPDGKLLASSDGKTVKLWDAASRRAVTTLVAHSGEMNDVAFSPDRSLIASAGADGTVKLWGTASGREVAALRGHAGPVNSVAFSPDGRLMVTGSMDLTVKLWEVIHRRDGRGAAGGLSPELRPLATLKGAWQEAVVFALAFSPDGKTLAASHWSGNVRLWSVTRRREVGTLVGHKQAVLSVAFSPDGKMIASGSNDTTVKLWEVASRREVAWLRGHTDQVNSVAFSPDGKRLVSGSRDKTARVWDTTTNRQRDTLQEGGKPEEDLDIFDVAFSPDGKWLATGSADRNVRLWNVAAGRQVGTLRGHQKAIASIAFSPDGKILASGTGVWNAGRTQVNEIKLWDVSSRQEVATLPPQKTAIWSLAFSPDHRLLASSHSDQSVTLWDLSAGRPWLTLPGYTNSWHSLAFSPDGKMLATLPANEVKLWNVSARREVATLPAPAEPSRIAFSPDGKRVATSNWDDTITVWDLSTKQGVTSHRALSWHIAGLAFSPDGKRLATGSEDNTVRLWDVSTARVITVLQGHPTSVHPVAFSPDGNVLASGGVDGTLRLWRAATFAETDAAGSATQQSPP